MLISIGSVWGRITTPDVSPYIASKFAVRSFSEVLRQELRHEPDIHVVQIHPQAVDTPIFERAANYSGREVRPIPPLMKPETVAQGVVDCARDPKPEVTYRGFGKAAELLHSLAPGLYQRVVPGGFEAGNYGSGSAPIGANDVMDADHGSRAVSGGWMGDPLGLAKALASAAGGSAKALVRGR